MAVKILLLFIYLVLLDEKLFAATCDPSIKQPIKLANGSTLVACGSSDNSTFKIDDKTYSDTDISVVPTKKPDSTWVKNSRELKFYFLDNKSEFFVYDPNGRQTNEKALKTGELEKYSDFYAVWFASIGGDEGPVSIPTHVREFKCRPGKACEVAEPKCALENGVLIPYDIERKWEIWSEQYYGSFNCSGRSTVIAPYIKTELKDFNKISLFGKPLIAVKFSNLKVQQDEGRYLLPAFVKTNEGWKSVPTLEKEAKFNSLESLPGQAHISFLDPASLVRMSWPSVSPFHFETKPFQWNPKKKIKWNYVYDGKSIADAESDLISNKGYLITKWEQSEKFEHAQRNQNGITLASNLRKIQDPDKWMLAKPGEKTIVAARSEYKKLFPNYMVCKSTKIETSNRSISDEDLLVNPRAFKSKTGQWLVGIKNRQSDDQKCMQNPDGAEFYERPKYAQILWYAISKDTRLTLSGETESIAPLEAADFDGDGHSEWIFAVPLNSLRLYSNGFRSSVDLQP